MASPPPPYSNVTGVARAVMKYDAQTSFTNYNGNARPGELVVDTSNYALYIGNANGDLNIVTGGGGSSISNGTSNVNIATANGNVTTTANGNTTLTVTEIGANITGYANITGDVSASNLVAGNANIKFDNVGDAAQLMYTANKWYVVGGTANVTY